MENNLDERKAIALETIAKELADIRNCLTYPNGDTYNTIGDALRSLEDGNPKSLLGTLQSMKDTMDEISETLQDRM